MALHEWNWPIQYHLNELAPFSMTSNRNFAKIMKPKSFVKNRFKSIVGTPPPLLTHHGQLAFPSAWHLIRCDAHHAAVALSAYGPIWTSPFSLCCCCCWCCLILYRWCCCCEWHLFDASVDFTHWTFRNLNITYKFINKPWSSGYGRRLTFWRSWVRIPALYARWPFLHINLL